MAEPASSTPNRTPAEQAAWEHATGQHVLEDRADLYDSADVKVRLEFVRNATESMRNRFERHADEVAKNTAMDQLGPVLARSGFDLIETPFGRTHEKMWGRKLLDVSIAAAPLLDQVEWGPDDFQLAEGFAEYVSLMPWGPRLELTRTDPRHDQLEVAEYFRWLQAQSCEPSFRGGIVVSIFVLGPMRPRFLADFSAQPHSSSTTVGGVELRLAQPATSEPRSWVGDVAFAWFLGRNAGLPPNCTIMQAVDSEGRVLWTCALPRMEYPAFSDATRDEPCGWRVLLARDGQVSGGNELMLFLDQDCRPTFYLLKFD